MMSFIKKDRERVIYLEDCLMDVVNNLTVEQIVVMTGMDRTRASQIKFTVLEIKEKRGMRK